MGVFSDMNMGFTDGTGSPFEDEGVFGQASEFEQTESLPVSGGGLIASIIAGTIAIVLIPGISILLPALMK